jgi:energy-coupling factor transporter ATP-binding protein EcfA2
MPYALNVENKEDVILQKELPSISFKYKDRGETTTVAEHELLQRLSNGEKKALYLLNIIFEIEARKELSRRTLLIMDDIADSFDYRNKYAIIEYIKEIVENDLFMPIILTHNFDFYRTVAGRVNIKNNSNFVNKSNEMIELIHGQYFENVFDSWRGQIYKNSAVFIASIAFLRNIVEYIDGKEDAIYKNLTSLLHFKKNPGDGYIATDVMTNDQLIGWYSDELNHERDRFEQNKAQKVIDLIFTTAESIMGKPDGTVNIENKIVLSIAIRQKAERYMIERVNDDSMTDAITGNQTRELRNMIEFNLNNSADRKVKEVIERVLIITSENIHINSFMYEPIVDMSLGELKKLYVDVEQHLI